MLTIAPVDSALVSPGVPLALPNVVSLPDMGEGVSFNLFNNLWWAGRRRTVAHPMHRGGACLWAATSGQPVAALPCTWRPPSPHLPPPSSPLLATPPLFNHTKGNKLHHVRRPATARPGAGGRARCAATNGRSSPAPAAKVSDACCSLPGFNHPITRMHYPTLPPTPLRWWPWQEGGEDPAVRFTVAGAAPAPGRCSSVAVTGMSLSR